MDCLTAGIFVQTPCNYPCNYEKPACPIIDFCFQADFGISIMKQLGFCINLFKSDSRSELQEMLSNGSLNFLATGQYLDDYRSLKSFKFSSPLDATSNGFVLKFQTRNEYINLSIFSAFSLQIWLILFSTIFITYLTKILARNFLQKSQIFSIFYEMEKLLFFVVIGGLYQVSAYQDLVEFFRPKIAINSWANLADALESKKFQMVTYSYNRNLLATINSSDPRL